MNNAILRCDTCTMGRRSAVTNRVHNGSVFSFILPGLPFLHLPFSQILHLALSREKCGHPVHIGHICQLVHPLPHSHPLHPIHYSAPLLSVGHLSVSLMIPPTAKLFNLPLRVNRPNSGCNRAIKYFRVCPLSKNCILLICRNITNVLFPSCSLGPQTFPGAGNSLCGAYGGHAPLATCEKCPFLPHFISHLHLVPCLD